ncbi:MAG TPA: hypothetical protein VF736_18630 [Pyrinomonadaceae bacterium]|jgi:hypothetical protein
MRATPKAFALLCALACVVQAQTRRAPYGLPAGARVLEERPLDAGGAKKRALVLWMLRPKKQPFAGGDDEPYTCPDETRGSYYTGPTRVSLVDTAAGRVVNTVGVTQEYNEGADRFDVPYSIRRGGYYHVEGVPEGKPGRPQIMRLRDYNGDGEALEFALFDALACMGLQTSLFGYSRKQDRVIQYPLHVAQGDGVRRPARVVRYWMDYLFAREPSAPGRWKYEVDYRGRGGTLDRHEIRYNPRLERFEGSVVYYDGP